MSFHDVLVFIIVFCQSPIAINLHMLVCLDIRTFQWSPLGTNNIFLKYLPFSGCVEKIVFDSKCKQQKEH